MDFKNADIKTLSYYLLVSVTALLSFICLIYQLNTFSTAPEKPIAPRNPIPSTDTTTTNLSSASTPENTSKQASSATDKAKTTTTSSEAETKKEITTLTPLNVTLTAELDHEETTDQDTIKTYTITEPLDQTDFEVRLTQVTLSKLSDEGMKLLGQVGEGILDVALSINNKSKKDMQIYPLKINLHANNKTYPIVLAESFQDKTIKAGENEEGSFLAALPKLKKITDLNEFTFNWVIASDNIAQPYKITVNLN